jgi:methyl-accepting chemotaxis protein
MVGFVVERVGIVHRMWIAPAVPILTLWACIAYYNVLGFGTAADMARLSVTADISQQVASLTADLQRERELAPTAGKPLLNQEAVTDQHRDEWGRFVARLPKSGLPADLPRKLTEAESALASLPALRTRIGSDPAARIIGEYSSRIDTLLLIVDSLVTLPIHPEGVARMAAFRHIGMAQERAAREHALAQAKLDTANLGIEQEALLAAFRLHSSLDERALLDQAPPGPSAGRREALAQVTTRVAGDLGVLARSSAAEARHAIVIFDIGMAGAALLGTIVVFVLVRGLTGPLGQMTKMMGWLATGDTSKPVPETHRRDEIGEMARALEVFKNNAQRVAEMANREADARVQAEAERRQAMQGMADTVERETSSVVAHVAEESGRVREMAIMMASSAERVSTNSQGVADAALQALDNVQVVSNAADHLAHAIREIAEQMGASSAMVACAGDATRRAGAIIDQLVGASARIDEVVLMIAEIAAQTNLLALNASIEAQRAGDSGKGFAVVAGEVKRLATMTANETEEISRQVADLQQIARSAATAFGDVSQSMSQVESLSNRVADAVAQQDAATNNIAMNVGHTSEAARQVSQRIAEVAGEAASSGERAGEVLGSLDAMSNQVARLSSVLTAVVRTATPDVNRRRRSRLRSPSPATLDIEGKRYEGTLLDLSPVAGRVRGLPPVNPESLGTLHWRDFSIPVTVAGQKEDVVRVRVRTGWEGGDRLLEILASLSEAC